MKLSLTRAVAASVVCAVLLSSRVVAQTNVQTAGPTPANVQPGGMFNSLSGGVGRATLENSAGAAVPVPFGPRMNVTGSFGDAPGYDANLFSVNAFVPNHLVPGESLFFESLTGSVTFDGSPIANLGLGYRQYVPELDRIFGISVWGDVDDGHASTYYRGGVSVESLGRYLDFLFNGYALIGDDSSMISDTTFGDPVFQGNFIGLASSRIQEFAFGGFDVEIGGPLPLLGRYGVSAYVGGYYRTSESFDDIMGPSVRVRAYATEDIDIGVRYGQDDVFGAQTYATVTLALPAGAPVNWFRPRRVKDRLDDPVHRDTRIPAHVENFVSFSALLDPDTFVPIFVQHIDPDAPEGGSGTFEDPWGSVEEFINTPTTDIIFVSAGETSPEDLDSGLTLFGGQRLLSEAVEHTFLARRTVDDPVERFLLPGFNPDAPLPVLLNSTGDVIVTGAGFNEVSGFGFDGTPEDPNDPLASGYVNPTAAGFDINRNVFDNVSRGVAITNVADGFGIIEDTDVFGDGDETDLGIAVRAVGGSTLELLVRNNTANNITGVNEDLDDDNLMDPGEDVNGNGVLDRGTGIEITAAGPGTTILADDFFDETEVDGDDTDVTEILPLGIANNTTNANGQGMSLNAIGGAVVSTELHGNLAQNNEFDGLSANANTGGEMFMIAGPVPDFDVDADGDLDDDGIVDVIEEEEVAANAILDPFTPDNIYNSNGTADVDDNTGSGIHLRAFAGGMVTASIEDTELNNNEFAGLAIEGDEGEIGVLVNANRMHRDTNGAHGIHFDVIESDTVALITRNEFTATLPTFDADGNVTAGNADVRFGIGGTISGGTLALTIGGPEEDEGNLFEDNAEAGIGLILSGQQPLTGVSATLSIQNNMIVGTVDPLNLDPTNPDVILANDPDFLGDGIRLLLYDGSTLEPSLIADNVVDENEGFGVAVTANENSTIDTLTILRNEITNNGTTATGVGGGVEVLRFENARIESTLPGMRGVNVIDNMINDNVGIGVHFFSTAGAATTLTYNVIGNEIERNGLEGILLESEFDAVMDVDIVMNDIIENGFDGISYLGLQFGSVTGTWALNNIIENGQNQTIADAVTASQTAPVTDSGTGNNGNEEGTDSVTITQTPGGNGIFISGNAGFNIDPLLPPDADTVVDRLVIAENLIDGNRFDGIDISMVGGAVNADILDNQMINNFVHGVDVFGYGAVVDLVFAGNRIGVDAIDVAHPNGGDGMQFQNFADDIIAFGLFDITIAESIVAYNGTAKVDAGIAGGRGIDILTKSDGQSEYMIIGNDISSNWFTGVYLMNTADPGQAQLGPTDALGRNGDVFDIPITQLHFIENNVDGNGLVGPVPDAIPNFDFSDNALLFGLAIRVGTSDADILGFNEFITKYLLAPDGFPEGEFASDGNGGVVAEVVNNTFSGNAGDDVYIDSFVSTVDPFVNGDPGSNDDPIVMDPLARLDLRFVGNTGDSLDVTNGFAFYNNSDPFKSPPAFFNDAGRDRNAVRLPYLVEVATGTVQEMTFEGTVLDNVNITSDDPQPNTFVGDTQLPDIDPQNENYFDDRDLFFITATDGTLVAHGPEPVGDYDPNDPDGRRFTFFPPDTFSPSTVTLDDTFSVTRTPQADNFDAIVFDPDGDPITADGAIVGTAIAFTSGAIGASERAAVLEFFGGVQDDTSSIYLSSPFSTAPAVGDTFDVLAVAAGLGPSTFRVETVDAAGTGLNAGFEFLRTGFILDNVDFFAPFDIYGAPLGEANGVFSNNPGALEYDGLPWGWTPIIAPDAIDFSNFPIFFP